MFVTPEEREPLGGVLGFVIPVLGAAALAAGAIWFASQQSGVWDRVGPLALIASITFILIYRQSRLISSLYGTIGVTGYYYAVTSLMSAPALSVMTFDLLALWLSLALAKAWVDLQAGERRPQWRHYFVSLCTLPLYGLALAALFVSLFLIAGIVAEVMGDKTFDAEVSNFIATGSLPAITVSVIVGAMAIMAVRSQRVLLGAIRYGVLYACRYALPVITALAITYALFVLMSYAGAETDLPISPKLLLILLLGVHLFVYQAGESAPPPGWLRVSAILAALVAPVLLWLEWETGGVVLDPVNENPTLTILAAAYPVFMIMGALHCAVALMGAVTEIKWRKPVWMPILSPLFFALALAWLLAFMIIAGRSSF